MKLSRDQKQALAHHINDLIRDKKEEKIKKFEKNKAVIKDTKTLMMLREQEAKIRASINKLTGIGNNVPHTTQKYETVLSDMARRHYNKANPIKRKDHSSRYYTNGGINETMDKITLLSISAKTIEEITEKLTEK